VQDGTRPSQRTATGTLATIADDAARASIGSPAIVVIGSVADLREKLRWFDKNALFGKHVLITRAGEQSRAFAWALLARGAQPILAPTIAFAVADDVAAAETAIDSLTSFAWLVFTSQNGVDAFFDRLNARDADARAIGNAKVAAIGERTAERLRSYGVRADLVPRVFIGEEVARAVIDRSQTGDRVLVYRAQEARDVVPRMLEEAGRVAVVVPAYKTVVPSDPEFAKKAAAADVLTFTSASTVRGFAELLGGDAAAARVAAGKCVACIGPITARAATDAGLQVDLVASTYTTAGLLDALEAYFATHS
jgi:uroporphyrinogen III methyltransferase/synthase